MVVWSPLLSHKTWSVGGSQKGLSAANTSRSAPPGEMICHVRTPVEVEVQLLVPLHRNSKFLMALTKTRHVTSPGSVRQQTYLWNNVCIKPNIWYDPATYPIVRLSPIPSWPNQPPNAALRLFPTFLVERWPTRRSMQASYDLWSCPMIFPVWVS